jgi:hypothetical protein
LVPACSRPASGIDEGADSTGSGAAPNRNHGSIPSGASLTSPTTITGRLAPENIATARSIESRRLVQPSGGTMTAGRGAAADSIGTSWARLAETGADMSLRCDTRLESRVSPASLHTPIEDTVNGANSTGLSTS